MISKSQRTATKWRPSGSHDHSEIDVLGSIYHFFFYRAGRFVNHRKDETISYIPLIDRYRFSWLQVTQYAS